MLSTGSSKSGSGTTCTSWCSASRSNWAGEQRRTSVWQIAVTDTLGPTRSASSRSHTSRRVSPNGWSSAQDISAVIRMPRNSCSSALATSSAKVWSIFSGSNIPPVRQASPTGSRVSRPARIAGLRSCPYRPGSSQCSASVR
nr:hypothetical protein [Actinocorallia populi]